MCTLNVQPPLDCTPLYRLHPLMSHTLLFIVCIVNIPSGQIIPNNIQ